jgi:hypothetical protein
MTPPAAPATEQPKRRSPDRAAGLQPAASCDSACRPPHITSFPTRVEAASSRFQIRPARRTSHITCHPTVLRACSPQRHMTLPAAPATAHPKRRSPDRAAGLQPAASHDSARRTPHITSFPTTSCTQSLIDNCCSRKLLWTVWTVWTAGEQVLSSIVAIMSMLRRRRLTMLNPSLQAGVASSP